MKVITVKFLNVTNTKGARLKAICEADSMTLGYFNSVDHNSEKSVQQQAAELLANKLGWLDNGQKIYGGIDHQQNHVFVIVEA